MIAQIILVCILLLITVYAYTQRKRSALVCYSITVTSFLGIAFVLFPEMANMLARSIGIGRGADLLLYCFIAFALMAILNLHLHVRSLMEIITENTRHITILEALAEERADRTKL